MMENDPTADDDISAGLVLHLDPAVLAQNGATRSAAAAKVTLGAHFFLCFACDTEHSWWTPLYTKKSTTRIELSRWGRSGHEKWTSARLEYDPAQQWVASLEAINAAAIAGRDRSYAGARNRVAVDQLPTLPRDAVIAPPEPVVTRKDTEQEPIKD